MQGKTGHEYENGNAADRSLISIERDTMFCKSLISILAVFIIAMPAADAQTTPFETSISIGPMLGYQKAKDADGNYMAGAAMRARLLRLIGFEGSINYRQENYGDGLTVKSWPVMASAMIYPLPMLYGVVGMGWYNTTFDFDESLESQGSEDDTKQKVGWHFGAGVELPASPKVKITGDIRYVFLDYDFQSVPGVGGADSDFFLIEAGILFEL
jgi:opacity protein-like surface antigen